MKASNFITKQTTNKRNGYRKATQIKNITELKSIINKGVKNPIQIFQLNGMCEPKKINEFQNLKATIIGDTFCIYDATNPNAKIIMLDKNSIRAYDKNEMSISIYPKSKEITGDDKYFNILILRKA